MWYGVWNELTALISTQHHLLYHSDHGLPVDSTNARGETALHDAVLAKSWDVVQELLRLGANREISATNGLVI